jgi:hypothetical protein
LGIDSTFDKVVIYYNEEGGYADVISVEISNDMNNDYKEVYTNTRGLGGNFTIEFGSLLESQFIFFYF